MPTAIKYFTFIAFLFQAAAQAQTELTLEVTAHDKKGNAILDLNSADLEVVDAGKTVPLKNLRLVSKPQVPPTVMLMFDEVVPGVAKTDRDLAEEFLKEASGHGLVFIVVRVEGRIHLMQGPTTDIEAVRKAIAITTMADRKELLKVTDAVEQQMEEDAKNAPASRQLMARVLKAILLDSQHTVQTDGRSTPTIAALLAASRGQEILPGRKFIVFFGQGIPHHDNSPEKLRDVARAANKARVSIYALDAEVGDSQVAAGLAATNTMGTEGAMGNINTAITDAAGTLAEANEFAGRMIAGEGTGNPQTLEGICVTTGGTHMYALGGDSRTRARGIADDLTSYYLATWISPSSDDTNRKIPIRVQPIRKGVIVQSRYAARVGDYEKGSAVESRLVEALAAPQLPAGLPFNAAVVRFGSTLDNDVDSVLVQVPLDASSPPAGKLSVLAQLRDKSGAVVQKFSADIPSRGQDLLSFRRQFSAPPGEYVLETAAMDGRAGKIGAQRSNVVIPPVAKGLALGDVLVVQRFDPAGSSTVSDPLACAEGIAVPNLSGHISKATSPKISLFFRLSTDTSSGEAPALSAELRRDGAPIGTVPLKLTVDPKRPAIPYVLALGAEKLRPGQYQITVILTQGAQTVSQSTAFRLE